MSWHLFTLRINRTPLTSILQLDSLVGWISGKENLEKKLKIVEF